MKTASNPTECEKEAYLRLVELFNTRKIPDSDILKALPVFMTRSSLSHLMFISKIYQMILNTSGDIFEFGVRWGRNMSLYSNFRAIYEPYNTSRKIVGFDTFEGFPHVSEKDGKADFVV